MIISRTPFRISFFGGGTDYPVWFREHGGAVLAAGINKYCYISIRHLPQFFEHKHRVVWSRVETVREAAEIQHPAVRAALLDLNIQAGLEIHHDSDLPARSGLGSSSAFMVGLLHALYALDGKMTSKALLAQEAIRMEQEVLKEHVGCQDQVLSAWGGFNKVTFHRDGSIDCAPMLLPRNRLDELQDSCMLFFSGISRFASEVAKAQIDNVKNRTKELHAMGQMVDEAIALLANPREDIGRFGRLMHESWNLKRSLSDRVTNQKIDEIYETAIAAGASGGKLMGAGGGGFLVFIVPPAFRQKVREALRNLVEVRVGFDFGGSRIIFYDPDTDFSKNGLSMLGPVKPDGAQDRVPPRAGTHPTFIVS